MATYQFTIMQRLKLLELSQALEREKLPEHKIPPQDKPYDVEFWLKECVERYNLGDHPYVQELYQQRFGIPIPSQYLQKKQGV